ncbi:MAG: type II secretion system F family protein [Phycisphaerales bacterium]
MTTFAYKTLASREMQTIDAPDRASALRLLARMGVTPASIAPVNEAHSIEVAASRDPTQRREEAAALRRAHSMSGANLAALVREIATALSAGLPLTTALRACAGRNTTSRRAVIIRALVSQIEQGRSFADAMEQFGRPFTELLVNLVRSGEASGKLPETMEQCADLLDRDVKLKRSIAGATLYPAILLVLIVIAIAIVVLFIVPTLLKKTGLSVAQLPLPTRILNDIAMFVKVYWPYLVLALGAGFFVLKATLAKPDVRLQVDRFLLQVPLLGPVLRDVAVARFTRTLATQVGSGLGVLTALRITKGTLGNKAMESVIEQVSDDVAGGKTIAEPMEKSGYFPEMLVQIVSLGEKSGRLDELLKQAAKSFDDRVEVSLKVFTAALPPILVVMGALGVGFVVLSILLALLEAQNATGIR